MLHVLKKTQTKQNHKKSPQNTPRNKKNKVISKTKKAYLFLWNWRQSLTPYGIKSSETFQYWLKIHHANAHLYSTDARTDGNCSPGATPPSTGSRKGLRFSPEASLGFVPKVKMWYADEEKSSVPETPHWENSP